MIEQSEGRYEFKEGKEFPIRVNAVDRTHAPYKWTFDAKNASGTYAYSTGDNCDDGTVALQIQEDGSVRYRIIGLTGAPLYRTACFPEDALSGETAAATLHGNRILIEEDENCAIELSLYSDFLVSRYLEGRYCQHLVGNGQLRKACSSKRRCMSKIAKGGLCRPLRWLSSEHGAQINRAAAHSAGHPPA